MKVNRYSVSREIVVAGSPERAYAIASAVDLIPVYEDGISQIEVIKEISSAERLVRSTLRFLGFDIAFIYRYRYSPSHHYSGVQESGSVVRGFFTFSFGSVPGGTRIVHREGVFSRIPLAATVVGWIYFRIFARDGLETELEKLKALIEAPQ